ncbi:hypothetical protein Hypma_001012 [Hypsizygus marmoreus]|uniref:Protein kinase domain-containing protein n=1 Tax=Hypsizygus marmoreus TaxID=39966 RepID=A0A369J6Y6_HYPMA|nr:hypothetical protein Hypma_001012 [Hypsizygus marmoreus]
MATDASRSVLRRQIAIAGVQLQSSFYRLAIEGCEYPDLPDNILLTRSPSLQRDDEISPSERMQWGTNEYFYDSALCFDCRTRDPDPSSGLHTWFKLKMILHREQGAESFAEDMAKELIREAKFYATHLRKLQGNTVPTHYGVWTAETSWGGSVMCEIMEHAGHPFQLGKHGTPENRDACAAAVLDLHRNGIVHKQLSHPKVTWHILWDKRKGIPRIVDFTCAIAGHECPRSLPLCRYESAPTEHISCHELIWAGEYLQLYKRQKAVEDDEEVQEALDMLVKYEAAHFGDGYETEDGLAVQESWIKQHRACRG